MSSIVIIEGDDLMCSLIKEWLAAAGYSVREAASAGAANHVDLVIVNLSMPRRAGAGTVRKIHQANPGVPVIAISAQFHPSLERSQDAARALGARRLIAKPFTRDDLLTAVQAVIGPAA
jgi:CheY-like chemotaxis protein